MKVECVLLLALALGACAGHDAGESVSAEAATEVTLTRASRGRIPQDILFQATTVYQNKSVISVPVASFVTEVWVSPGTMVKAGDLLFRLESKEQHVLQDTRQAIEIKAGRDGIIVEVQASVGNYLPEGTVICTLAEREGPVFEINVPYEQKGMARRGERCTMELPDGTRLWATVESILVEMNTASQSAKVMAKARDAPFLPEGLNVKALFTVHSAREAVSLLPKAAMQSDETLTSYWIMKLADDSTAIKVPVTVGHSTADSIEVLSPALS